jgi:hypothetical protein
MILRINQKFLIAVFLFCIFPVFLSGALEEAPSASDLIIDFIKVEFESGGIGTRMILNVKYANRGGAAVPRAFNIFISIKRYRWDSKTLLHDESWNIQAEPLAAQQSRVIVKRFARNPGIYMVVARIDTHQEVEEKNEGNNRKDHLFTVGIPPLKVEEVDLRVDNIYPEIGPLRIYNKVRIQCSLSNIGKSLRPGLDIQVKLSVANIEKKFKLKSTGGRESKYLGFDWTPDEVGRYTIRCEVELDNINEETLENNTLTRDIKVIGKGI